jgi:hypothetical protein
MILSDLCGQAKKCEQKEIDGKEYDICVECWKPLAEKLKGMGRARKERETVFLPHCRKNRNSQDRSHGPVSHRRFGVAQQSDGERGLNYCVSHHDPSIPSETGV